MPILANSPDHGAILSLTTAAPGWRAEAFAPRGTDTGQMPAPSHVVAWALVSDGDVAGGSRVEPVFLADGRTWTPDQYRGAYGQQITVRVGRE